jgi:predicted ATPase
MVSRFREEMHEGDPVILWQAGPEAGIYGLGELRNVPYQRKPDEQFFENGGETTEWGVDFTITDILDPPIKKADILEHPILGALNVIKGPQGTNFRVTAEQWKAVTELRSGASQPPAPLSLEPPDFGAIAAQVRALGLRLSERTLRRFHTAVETRGFVILSGISGTGKTWLAEAYAKAAGAEFLLVPVAPNWTSNEDLLGYFNPLDGQYHHTLFSQFLQRAADAFQVAEKAGRTPRRYLVLLDEMNLARVEQYFAKFLSGMEVRSRSRAAAIELWNDQQVLLTPNLYFVGTVNIDETTHGFADKVYDLAQLIELAIDRDDLADHVGTAVWGGALLQVWDAVADIAPFAYRVVDDIRAYIDHAHGQGATWEEALDEQVLQKVLPKLNGTDVRLQGALEQLVEWAQEAYPLTGAKAQRMLQAFQQHGFSSYF